MLYLSAVFFIVSIVAAFFGFGGVSVASAGIAQFLFVLFLVGFIVTLVMYFVRKVDNRSRI